MRFLPLLSLFSLGGCVVSEEALNEKVKSNLDRDGDGVTGQAHDGLDCDDENPEINPGADELCDGIDNNCDGEIDEDSATDASTWYADTDSDGYGDNDTAVKACDAPAGHVADNTDCDDNTAEIHPAASELCDGADNNCDGTVDEVSAIDALTWYADSDGDSYGDAGILLVSCDAPSGYIDDDTDCDDSDAEIHPDAEEVCDEVDNNCDGEIDEDDAGDAVTWYADTDGDGYGDSSDSTTSCQAPSTHVADDTDCNDANADVNPGGTETCNGADDDCDGDTDEPDATDASTWYADNDGDGFGNPAASVLACSQPASHVSDNTDCDDTSPSIHPGAAEDCLTVGVDDDCDGLADDDDSNPLNQSLWYADTDGDSYGNPNSFQSACTAPNGTVSDDTDCDDSSSAAHPGASEYCDGWDNDCDGTTDESDATDASTWYRDADGDGYGDTSNTTLACSEPIGYATLSGDCDDSLNSVNPGAQEICDGWDNDCDGLSDDDDPSVTGGTGSWVPDSDGDGYGDDSATPTALCGTPGSGWTSDTSDCDDNNAAVNPDAWESLGDSTDSDCDGDTDNLQWTTLSNHSPVRIKGIRMTAWEDTIYTSWAAEQVSSPVGNLANTLTTMVSDASDPLGASTALFSTSSFSMVDFHDPFDVIADGSYLYWAQSSTFSDFVDLSQVVFHTIDHSTLTVTAHATTQAQNTTPAQDVSLYFYEGEWDDMLQAAICSPSFSTNFIRGAASDFPSFSGITTWTTDDLGYALPPGNKCDSSAYFSTTDGQLYSSLVMSDYLSGNTGQADHWWYYAAQTNNILYFGNASLESLLDLAYSNDHGWKVGAFSYDNLPPMLYVFVGLSNSAWTDMTYNSIADRIEQLDAVASPSGQVAVCGITETGGARLYLMDPQNNATQIDTYSLDPLGTSYEECAITSGISGISGMLVVTLLDGTTISQGAIQIP